jgi:uncharacterized protein YbcC (UPF0753/DUF2309 family)
MLSADLQDYPAAAGNQERLRQLLPEVVRVIPPLWPLQDYVAVNPWLGCLDDSLLETRARLRELRNCELLPGWAYFRSRWQAGKIPLPTLELALQRCREDLPEHYSDLSLETILSMLEGNGMASHYDRLYFTVSESIDQQHGSYWNSHILNDITRLCSAYFDQGQAIWENPWRKNSLYSAWKQHNSISFRMDFLGLKGFRRMVQQLPGDPWQAIEFSLVQLALPPAHWKAFLQCQLLSMFGWASWIKKEVDFPSSPPASGALENLIGLLAIRLAYDAALRHQFAISVNEYCPVDAPAGEPPKATQNLSAPTRNSPNFRLDELVRYLLLTATEIRYQQALSLIQTASGPQSDSSPPASSVTPSKPLAQMIFCIDVRSEVFRRNLEQIDDSIETFGFAGFFGITMSHIRVGDSSGTPQCPVLLQPKISVQRGCLDLSNSPTDPLAPNVPTTATADPINQARRRHYRWLEIWKNFRLSAVSCFSFVESLGMLYSSRLLTDSLGWTRPAQTGCQPSLLSNADPSPNLQFLDDAGQPLALSAKTELAAGILGNLGLTSDFAPLVVFCGHQADVVNNPYRAGLDCGACGGHSGRPNAEAAAALFNDPQVRAGLKDRGMEIPETTTFLAAVHHTTTDDLELLNIPSIPEGSHFRWSRFQASLRTAAERCRQEKSLRTGSHHSRDFYRRSRDWSEVRPEWGLAGNAAFVAARRTRTQPLKLNGRVFLHSYDHQQDGEGKVLELIMTAPMVVASWINLQYYASTIDNRSYGSGNKLIHNVVGKFGILEGNGGDLKTGLPWQSLHDGIRLQHSPLRLTVLIEAPREKIEAVIRQHSGVSQLVSNGWLHLLAMEDDAIFRWTQQKLWAPAFASLAPKQPCSKTAPAKGTAAILNSNP